jgi:hypothetical protein
MAGTEWQNEGRGPGIVVWRRFGSRCNRQCFSVDRLPSRCDWCSLNWHVHHGFAPMAIACRRVATEVPPLACTMGLHPWLHRVLAICRPELSREATAGTSHGRESVGHATPSSVSRNATAGVPWPEPNAENEGLGPESWFGAGSVRDATGNVFRRRSTPAVALRLLVPELARPPWVRTHGYCMSSLRDWPCGRGNRSVAHPGSSCRGRRVVSRAAGENAELELMPWEVVQVSVQQEMGFDPLTVQSAIGFAAAPTEDEPPDWG